MLLNDSACKGYFLLVHVWPIILIVPCFFTTLLRMSWILNYIWFSCIKSPDISCWKIAFFHLTGHNLQEDVHIKLYKRWDFISGSGLLNNNTLTDIKKAIKNKLFILIIWVYIMKILFYTPIPREYHRDEMLVNLPCWLIFMNSFYSSS